jgi:hypothetical protein
MVQKDSGWLRMVQDDSGWLRMTQDGSGCVEDGSWLKWFRMAPDGLGGSVWFSGRFRMKMVMVIVFGVEKT